LGPVFGLNGGTSGWAGEDGPGVDFEPDRELGSRGHESGSRLGVWVRGRSGETGGVGRDGEVGETGGVGRDEVTGRVDGTGETGFDETGVSGLGEIGETGEVEGDGAGEAGQTGGVGGKPEDLDEYDANKEVGTRGESEEIGRSGTRESEDVGGVETRGRSEDTGAVGTCGESEDVSGVGTWGESEEIGVVGIGGIGAGGVGALGEEPGVVETGRTSGETGGTPEEIGEDGIRERSGETCSFGSPTETGTHGRAEETTGVGVGWMNAEELGVMRGAGSGEFGVAGVGETGVVGGSG